MLESVTFIGHVQSTLKDIKDCPLQEQENAPQAIVTIHAPFLKAINGLHAGMKVLLLTWLHKADREVLTTKPRNNPKAALTGVFATRSPDRPNPIGLHVADILEITDDGRIQVSNLEVLDGTPLIDIKPVI
ncbi:MAG TPA: tRNA (N6-threonylcarbamoyladenosine(37)-N6)-methyltransferase TrmO [Chryseolinea sp.]|nr:tRNA (N6-threonylcarbamoyladenosine(37)-N6)-methyltransferase TrmO [Chryseolinea sp.]